MSPSTPFDPDELLRDDEEQAPAVRGPRRRTIGEGPAAGREILTNTASTRVARVAGLARRSARSKHRRFLVEGPQGVREAVRFSQERVLDVYLTEVALERHSEIWQEAQDAGLYAHVVSGPVMEAMSRDAQGVLAVVAMDEATGSEALARALEGARLVAVLAEAQDPGNAGTMIRAADAAGADAVILARGSVEATSPKVVRASAGSLFHLPVVTGVALDDAVDAVRAAGLTVLAADARGDFDLFEAGDLLAAPSAWLLGNEAHGLPPEALGLADAVVSIPVYGKAESLNVAAAAALCLYTSARAVR
ncbi:RNA methyltransferase [Actinomyces slackii]|uniref:TrmH family tRNA/rRNA methyltransferase n=1 Tax=Actinomyces slackii TaxID=52774 RepID=A0A448KEV1_9ACTO|nr:RNA methyltransferase [Actinomyces slackii]VEG75487.1 Putative TrmH family tRNA/rRNA methyltransferase [Actinomyces slackii]